MQQINILQTQELISKKESIISQMDRARIEAQAKKDSLGNQYKEYTKDFKALIDEAKPLLNIEGDDLSEMEILEKLTLEITALVNELSTSIPENI